MTREEICQIDGNFGWAKKRERKGAKKMLVILGVCWLGDRVSDVVDVQMWFTGGT